MGGSPRRRHHVRLWLQPGGSVDARPIWLGATTYDRGVGLARDTREITHYRGQHRCRAGQARSTTSSLRCATSVHRVRGVGPIPSAATGGSYTDGMAAIAVLAHVAE